MILGLIRVGVASLVVSVQGCQSAAYGPWPRSPVAGTQRTYPCTYTAEKPSLDGSLTDPVWQLAPWSEPFVVIEGNQSAAPSQVTWIKLMWDKKYLYVGALLMETDVWATQNQPDAKLFLENNFEVFVDPDGDGQAYYEIEVNAKGAVFDLFLHKAYREGGPADHHWNCKELDGAVHVEGTLNDSRDQDKSWSVELAIPWGCLQPPANASGDSPEVQRSGDRPEIGDMWRMNFSRSQWELNKSEGGYVKKDEGRVDRWVWSPQWVADMHQPEHWGKVTFVRTH